MWVKTRTDVMQSVHLSDIARVVSAVRPDVTEVILPVTGGDSLEFRIDKELSALQALVSSPEKTNIVYSRRSGDIRVILFETIDPVETPVTTTGVLLAGS